MGLKKESAAAHCEKGGSKLHEGTKKPMLFEVYWLGQSMFWGLVSDKNTVESHVLVMKHSLCPC